MKTVWKRLILKACQMYIFAAASHNHLVFEMELNILPFSFSDEGECNQMRIRCVQVNNVPHVKPWSDIRHNRVLSSFTWDLLHLEWDNSSD